MNDKPCPFCSDDLDVIAESDHCFAIRDGYPVSEGHTLVIAKRHVPDFYELSDEEQEDCWKLVHRMKKALVKEHRPDGFNIGINIGPAAGQTVFHVHIHIIPRYEGDMDDPRGGVRHVVEGKGYY